MARSGFRRGLVFYAIDLVGFVGTVLLAIRFHEIPATIYEGLGMSTRTAAVAGGLTIFVPLIVATAIIGSKLSHAMYRPGLYTTNRVLGAAFAAVLAATLIVVALLFARSAQLPFGISGLVDRSLIAPRVIDAAAPVVREIDRRFGLDLCGGRLARDAPDVCGEP